MTRRTRRSARRSLVEREGQWPAASAVTSVELFFDLVFVFAITQLTAAVGRDPTWHGVGRVVLLLALMWWMYGGYAWLTNAAPPVTTARRLFLLAGMTANFVMALAVPHAFGVDAVLFALGYVVVVAVHAGMYLTQTARVTWGMVWQLLVGNGLGAALVVLGAVLGGAPLVGCWCAALAAEIVLPRTLGVLAIGEEDAPGFAVQPAHFVERHGLMLLIALGESVLAIGAGLATSHGADAVRLGAAQVGFAAISLGLAAALFWAYFGSGEDQAAEAALSHGPRRPDAVALHAFGYAFGVVLLGVVLLASGLHHALAEPLHSLGPEWSLLLGGGAGLVWLGLAAFRVALGRADGWLRLGAAFLCGLTALVAARQSGVAAVGAVLLVCLVVLAVEARRPLPHDVIRSGRPSSHDA